MDPFLNKLKEAGYRLTQQRKKVLQVLLAANKPLGKATMVRFLEKDLDPVSVYRTIELFEELRLVHRSGEGLYILCHHLECGEGDHFILQCNECKKFWEDHIPEKITKSLYQYVKQNFKFQVTGHSFVMDGVCRECQ